MNKDSKKHYLVTKFAEGGSLLEKIKIGFKEEDIFAFVKRCASIFKYLHLTLLKDFRSKEGKKEEPLSILHRDVKPANLVYDNKQVYLIDFGIAKVGYFESRRSYTNSGTLNYKAPEID